MQRIFPHGRQRFRPTTDKLFQHINTAASWRGFHPSAFRSKHVSVSTSSKSLTISTCRPSAAAKWRGHHPFESNSRASRGFHWRIRLGKSAWLSGGGYATTVSTSRTACWSSSNIFSTLPTIAASSSLLSKVAILFCVQPNFTSTNFRMVWFYS